MAELIRIRVATVCLLLGVGMAIAPGAARAATPDRPASTPVASGASPSRPMADATLLPALAGEFALQAGQLGEASKYYLQAARAEDDAGLAERATRIAMLANDVPAAEAALALWRERAPGTLQVAGAEVVMVLRRGDAEDARRRLRALLADADPAGWHYALAALSSGGGQPVLVTMLLAQLVDDGAIPDQLVAWQEFGRLALRLDQPVLAERIVAEVVRRFPDDPRVALLRATQLNQAGRVTDARKALDDVAPRIGPDPELRGLLALAYDSIGAPAEGARVLAAGPQDTQTYGLRASLLAKAEDKAALLRLYDELRKAASRPDPERRLLLGKMAEFLDRPREAVTWYRGVPAGDARIEARLRSAAALYQLGQHAEAYAEARALQDDGDASDEARHDAFLLEAELHRRGNDDAGELEVLERGLGAYPDENALLYARALAWERRDNIGRAEADLRRVLVTDPNNIAALNALGYTLADRTDRYGEALALIDRARLAEPDNVAIIDSYGWVLYRLGRTDEALVQLRRAHGLAKDAEIAAHLAQVLWASGQKDEAMQYFAESARLDKDNRSLQRALEVTGVVLPAAATPRPAAQTPAAVRRPVPAAAPARP